MYKRQVEKLADTLRNQVEEVRQLERAVLHTCVDRAGMPRTHFIKVFQMCIRDRY